MKYISSFFAISLNYKNKDKKTLILLLSASSLLAYSILTYNLHYSLAIYALPSRGGSGAPSTSAAPISHDPSPQMNMQRNEPSQNKFARPPNNPIQQPNVIRPNVQCSTIVDGNSRRSTTATGVNANNCNNINGQVIINPGSSESSSLVINNRAGTSSNNYGTSAQVQSQYVVPMLVSYPPIANAGYSQNVHSNDYVVLDGSGSYDPYGNALYYSWLQPSSQNPIALSSNYNQPTATFVAPQVTEITTVTFELIVNNAKQNSNPSYTTVTIYP